MAKSPEDESALVGYRGDGTNMRYDKLEGDEIAKTLRNARDSFTSMTTDLPTGTAVYVSPALAAAVARIEGAGNTVRAELADEWGALAGAVDAAGEGMFALEAAHWWYVNTFRSKL